MTTTTWARSQAGFRGRILDIKARSLPAVFSFSNDPSDNLLARIAQQNRIYHFLPDIYYFSSKYQRSIAMATVNPVLGNTKKITFAIEKTPGPTKPNQILRPPLKATLKIPVGEKGIEWINDMTGSVGLIDAVTKSDVSSFLGGTMHVTPTSNMILSNTVMQLDFVWGGLFITEPGRYQLKPTIWTPPKDSNQSSPQEVASTTSPTIKCSD